MASSPLSHGIADAPRDARADTRNAKVLREDLTFDSQGTRCAAWYYRPRTGVTAPCVVVAHGFDGVREQRLDSYAERFAAAGMAVLVFDYRNLGSSDGQPRQLIDNRQQLSDWRAAIAFARSLDGVDASQIGLWGTSTSGGHVVQLAADDAGIAAVVAQMPLLDGFAQLLNTPATQTLRLLWAGLKDRIRGVLGWKPLLIPAAGRPASLAAVTSPDALSGLARITPSGSTWRNEVLARFALTTALYRPGRAARRVRCPLLLCLADGDRLIPPAPALKVAKVAGRAELRRYPTGHFAMYFGEGFERAVAHQTSFLCRAFDLPRLEDRCLLAPPAEGLR
jgi:fermentation-respiration switch protein FrsA (DUF1100 family)